MLRVGFVCRSRRKMPARSLIASFGFALAARGQVHVHGAAGDLSGMVIVGANEAALSFFALTIATGLKRPNKPGA